MTPGTLLRLGRVSNLPTVWTNVLAALALAGETGFRAATVVLLVAMSLFYVAGMYLNDAFDAPRDARERPARPIPAGQAPRAAVFAMGFAALAAGIGLLAWSGGRMAGTAWPAAAVGGGLAVAIVVYDLWHKSNPFSPVFMGLNRLLVYVATGVAAAGALRVEVAGAGALLLCYVLGLTYAAKQEHLGRIGSLWPLLFLSAPFAAAAVYLPHASAFALVIVLAFLAWTVRAVGLLVGQRREVGRAVVSLIAGIALFDASVLAFARQPGAAALCVGAFALTLVLQRYVPGT